jgi:hypothetical protein
VSDPSLQGRFWAAAGEQELREGLEQAFDYRGDVTLHLKDGSKLEGYVFDRRSGATLADSVVRVIPAGERRKVPVSFADIASLSFSGRDMAAGKSWEAWVRNYLAKKAAGETGIELKPEELE